MFKPTLSARAEAVTRRTYNRPLDEKGEVLETWEQTAQRATINHHRRLWEGAGGKVDEGELQELYTLVVNRQALVSGRTLWLGGTEYGTDRACSQFNCSFSQARTVYQMVDIFWLLLNGCGVGAAPVPGTLHGFLKPIRELEIIQSQQSPDHRGSDSNSEIMPTAENGYHWTIKIGDSAMAWAKSLGKLLNPAHCVVNRLTLDFSDLRGAGKRLKGYGWICNGAAPLEQAYKHIFRILNSKAGDLLDEVDLLDIVNHLGTVLSSRRSAQIMLLDWGHPRWEQFARAKQSWWRCNVCGSESNGGSMDCAACGGYTNAHRQQSNNSLVFWHKPSKQEIRQLMELIWECGGSEPGFVNGAAARRRAPWFQGLNPCGEILLSNMGFCNLVTTAVSKFADDFAALLRALHIMGRANYRQTCVDLHDGILQPEWHQTNEALRLCGMSMTGIAQAPWLTDYQIKQLRNAAISGCYSMADELGLPRPKLVTTIKPEGTGSKIMDVTEGGHKPLGRFIFNWVGFGTTDPIVSVLAAAGYRTIKHPTDPNNVLVCFPVDYSGCRFTNVNGRFINTDTAIDQLNNYRRWQTLWSDHNTSITVSWDISEIDAIVDWLYHYWDDFVGVSWLRRIDPTLTPKDLGYAYLPQEVAFEEDYREYTSQLKSVDWSGLHGIHDLTMSDCDKGVCPVK